MEKETCITDRSQKGVHTYYKQAVWTYNWVNC